MKIEIKVVPQSGRQKIVQEPSGVIKCFLKSAPVDGKANRELIKYVAKLLSVAQKDIEIVRGLTDRKKLLDIQGFESEDALLVALGLELQKKLF